MYLIFDTETTGLPRNFKAPITDTDNWPRCIQIAWQLHDDMGRLVEAKDYLVKPEGFDIPFQAEKIHGISTDLAIEQGESLEFVLREFNKVLAKSKFVVGQNVKFDTNVMGCEFHRLTVENQLQELPVLDTCTEITASLCQIPGGRGGKFKLPTLTELHQHLFNQPFGEAHNATADVEATTRCFLELIRIGSYSKEILEVEGKYFNDFLELNPLEIVPVGLKHLNLKEASDKIRKRKVREEGGSTVEVNEAENRARLKDVQFAHLHNHTQFSILQSTTAIPDLIAAAVKNKMRAVAFSDIGNMMAAFHFTLATQKHNGGVNGKIKDLKASLSSSVIEEEIEENGKTILKTRPLEPEELLDIEEEIVALGKTILLPIIGSELFVCKNRLEKSVKDNGYRVPIFAKNKKGYNNLAKISSAGHVEGFYYVPRVDKEKILEYKEDLIITTGGLQGEIPQMILNVGIKQAEEAFVWWKDNFGEDFYVELNRHGLEEEQLVNDTLLGFAKKI